MARFYARQHYDLLFAATDKLDDLYELTAD